MKRLSAGKAGLSLLVYLSLPTLASLVYLALPGFAARGDPSRNYKALNECWSEVKTRVEINACLARKYNDADTALASEVDKATNRMKELDSVSSTNVGAQRAFLASQKAFESYRQTDCDWYAASAGSGTGSHDFQMSCRVDLTQMRIREIRNILGD